MMKAHSKPEPEPKPEAKSKISIFTKIFEETRTIYTKSESLEIFMGSDTEDVIDKLFNTLLQRFKRAQETSNERGSKSIPDSVELLYYDFQRIDFR